jgi:hypothetical protein
MKPDPAIKLWTCPKCGRQFVKSNQSHSCKIFPLEKHFEGKEKGHQLYLTLKQAIRKNIGPFKVDSVECCIHLVKASTFAAVKILRDKIRVDFTLTYKVKNKRLIALEQMSAYRYLYYMDINSAEQIDEELTGWLKEAYEERKQKAA